MLPAAVAAGGPQAAQPLHPAPGSARDEGFGSPGIKTSSTQSGTSSVPTLCEIALGVLLICVWTYPHVSASPFQFLPRRAQQCQSHPAAAAEL